GTAPAVRHPQLPFPPPLPPKHPPVQGGTPMTARTMRRRFTMTAGAAVAALALAGCTGNTVEEETTAAEQPTSGETGTAAPAAGGNEEEGETVVIGFSVPAADHGWMGAMTTQAQAEAEKYGDIDLRVAEGTNDVNLQISQIETFINDGVDAIVILPFDGAALTGVALEAMAAGIPVINVDREFSDPNAARVTVLDIGRAS